MVSEFRWPIITGSELPSTATLKIDAPKDVSRK